METEEITTETVITDQMDPETLESTHTETITAEIPVPEPAPDRWGEVLERLERLEVLMTPQPEPEPEEEVTENVEVVEEPEPMVPRRRSLKRS